MLELDKIREKTETVHNYMKGLGSSAHSFVDRYNSYSIDNEVKTKLKCHSINAFILVFSAEWCPDCSRNIPVLAQISEETGIEVRVFGHLERAPKGSDEKWMVPPSPPEVKEFDVVKIPTIIVYDSRGKRIGEIIENPPKGVSLEKAVLGILES